MNPDGTGSAECPLDDPLPDFPATEMFDFVLEQHARAFRLVGTTPGVVVLGALSGNRASPDPRDRLFSLVRLNSQS